MKKTRTNFHNELLKFCPNVYFQPPENLRMKYPCIVYSRSTDYTTHSNDKFYFATRRYDLTLIGFKVTDEISDEMRAYFPMCEVTQYYVADNLNHTKIKIYF